jgi:hypothetical protein
MSEAAKTKDKPPPDLNELLKAIESRDGFLDYHGLDAQIMNTWREFSDEALPFEWLSEVLAFQFMEEYPSQIEGYGDYFGPMMEGTSADGVPVRIPDVRQVTKEMIAYWAERAKSSSHPVMAARYSGLIIDLSKIVTEKAPAYEIAKIYFENLIKISQERLQEHEMDIVHKLERALQIAISFKKDDWLSRAREEIIAYQSVADRDDAPGYWAMAYRLLIENKKSGITAEQEKDIIDNLERRLSSIELKTREGEIVDPWNFETAAQPLANYYKRKNRKEDLSRVVTIWGNAFETAIESVSGMLASSWLQHIDEVYSLYGFKDKSEAVAIKLREAGKGVKDDLSEHEFSVEIPKEEIERIVKAFTDDGLETALIRIAMQFIPKVEKTKEQVERLFKSSPLSYMIPRQLMDEKGRVVAVVGPYEADQNGHIVQQMAQEIDIDSSIYLHPVVEEAINSLGLNEATLMEFISKSSVVKSDGLSIIKKGVASFFEKDFFVFSSLVIPQIEEGIRNLQELFGGAVLKPNRGGGYNYKNLEELLREDIVTQALGQDFVFYARVVMTDARGWNLRNDVCHGLRKEVSENHALRIIHILLCLALIRPKEQS